MKTAKKSVKKKTVKKPEKSIQIICEGAETMPVKDMVVIQRQLKVLTPENNERLRNSILKHGFAFPVTLARIKKKVYGIVDASQRHRVVSEMIDEGFVLLNKNGKTTKELPVTFVDCKSKKQAGELILMAISQFGKVTHAGFQDFVDDFDLNPSTFVAFDIPEFDVTPYVPMDFQDVNFSPNNNPEIGSENITDADIQKQADNNKNPFEFKVKNEPIICPKCGHEFEVKRA